jgi:hypothetical protein
VSGTEAGPGVDAQGRPVIDPTRNVLDLVAAAIQRQDDLRKADAEHIRESTKLRAVYEDKLRAAETARIDAIRAVDVGAVQRAAEVSAQQASTLAAQVANSAEALRTQVQAAATAAEQKLSAALEPIQKDIADLRRAQYEAQGQKTQVIETHAQTADVRGGGTLLTAVLGVGIGFLVLLLTALSVYLAMRPHG